MPHTELTMYRPVGPLCPWRQQRDGDVSLGRGDWRTHTGQVTDHGTNPRSGRAPERVGSGLLAVLILRPTVKAISPRVSSRGSAKATCDSTLVPMTETQPCSLKTIQSGARCGGVGPAWWTNEPSGAPFPRPVGTSAQSTGPHHYLSGPHDAQRCEGDIETSVLPCDSPSLVAGSRSHTACQSRSLVLLTTIKANQRDTSQLGPQNCTFPERRTHSRCPHAEWPD